MSKPVSLVPPRPGDGSGICESRDDDRHRPDPIEDLRSCATDGCNADLPPTNGHETCPQCREEENNE